MSAALDPDADGPEPSPEPTPLPWQIDTRVVLGGILFLLAFHFAYFARSLLLPLFAAVVAHLALKPVVRRLGRWRVPPPAAAALVMVVFVALLGGGGYALVGPATDWIARAPQSASAIERKLRPVKEPVREMARATERVQDITNVEPSSTPAVKVSPPPLLSTLLDQTNQFLGGAAVCVVLLFLLLASGDRFLAKVVASLPRLSDKKRAVEIARGIETEISAYLFTVSLVNGTLGVVVGATMYLIGMPNPALWGALTAVLNFVPYLGPATMLVVLTAVALLSFDTLHQAVVVPAVFLAITTVEGQILTPYVIGRRFLLSPVVVFVGLVAWTWIWGIPGAVLAAPLLVMLKITADRLEPLAPVSELLGR